jgi:hypothetical protein
MEGVVYHSDFYGKKLVRVVLQPLVNWRQQAKAHIERFKLINVLGKWQKTLFSEVGRPLVRVGAQVYEMPA